MIITLLGEPKSTNSLYRYACRGNFPAMYMTKDAKDLKESYQWQAKSQYKGKITILPLEINVKFYFKNNRKHDIDNYSKILLDSLTGIVWEDDDQIWKATYSKWHDKENPRIEIETYNAI